MKKKQEAPTLTLYIDSIKFEVQRDLKRAMCQMDVVRTATGKKNPGRTEYTVKFAINNIWVDGRNDAIRSFLMVHENSVQQNRFITELIQVGKARTCFNDMVLTGHKKHIPVVNKKPGGMGDIVGQIRYGIDLPGQYSFEERGTYEQKAIFESKDRMARAFLEFLGHSRTIGGLDMVNFESLPDTMFQSMGFEMIPDSLRRGPAMWMGNLDKIMPQIYGREKDEMINSFLTMMDEELRKPELV